LIVFIRFYNSKEYHVLIISEIFVEFFTFISIYFILDYNIELTRRIFTTPIRLHDSIDKFLNVGDLLIGFILIKLIASPNKNFMLIMLMAWYVDLWFDTKYQ